MSADDDDDDDNLPRRGPGRPRLAAADRRTERVGLSLDASELSRLDSARGTTSRSVYARQRLLAGVFVAEPSARPVDTAGLVRVRDLGRELNDAVLALRLTVAAAATPQSELGATRAAALCELLATLGDELDQLIALQAVEDPR